MKRLMALIFAFVLLSGCSLGDDEIDRAMTLRDQILHNEGITFDGVITADYGDTVHTFGMHCRFDSAGDLSFEIYDPDTISGIQGTISDNTGKLTFESTVLAFSLLADGQITPVSAPWILIKTLRSGYLNACGMDDGVLRIEFDDTYAEDALHVELWTDEKDMPSRAELLWQGRRILTIDIRNFCFL